MGGFNQAMVNGVGVMVRKVMQSLGFVSGSTGWQIKQDGTAEFQNVTMRGSVQVGGVAPGPREVIGGVIPNELVTYYAAGSPETVSAPETVVALTKQAFDGQGNYVYEVVLVDSTSPNKITSLSQGKVIAGTVNEYYRAVLNPNVTPAAVLTDFYKNEVFFEADNVNFDVISAGLPADSGGGRWIVDAGGGHYYGPGGATAPDTFFGRAGTQLLVADGIAANTAGAGARGTAEVWNAMTLQNSWVNSGGSDVPAQYRKVAAPVNCVQVVGSIKNGTKTNGTVVATLPVGYRPATHKVLFNVAIDTVSGTTFPRMTLNTDGTLTIDNCTAATFIFFNAVIPLDA